MPQFFTGILWYFAKFLPKLYAIFAFDEFSSINDNSNFVLETEIIFGVFNKFYLLKCANPKASVWK